MLPPHFSSEGRRRFGWSPPWPRRVLRPGRARQCLRHRPRIASIGQRVEGSQRRRPGVRPIGRSERWRALLGHADRGDELFGCEAQRFLAQAREQEDARVFEHLAHMRVDTQTGRAASSLGRALTHPPRDAVEVSPDERSAVVLQRDRAIEQSQEAHAEQHERRHERGDRARRRRRDLGAGDQQPGHDDGERQPPKTSEQEAPIHAQGVSSREPGSPRVGEGHVDDATHEDGDEGDGVSEHG